LGVALALSGRVDAAVPLLTQALEQASGTAAVVLQARCRLALGQAQVLAGRLEEAQVLAERTLALARAHRQRGVQAYALCLLGEIAAQRIPPGHETAAGYYHQALVLAEALAMRPLSAHGHLGLGNLYADTGRCTEARAELSAAIDLYRALDMTFWLPQAEAALAQLGPR
jgi:tetratricopeptide (TPR) repeat protein